MVEKAEVGDGAGTMSSTVGMVDVGVGARSKSMVADTLPLAAAANSISMGRAGTVMSATHTTGINIFSQLP